MQHQWGFVKLLIKEFYIATSKSMTLCGKMTFMEHKTLLFVQVLFCNSKRYPGMSKRKMDKWKEKATCPFLAKQIHCKGKWYFFV
jgi:hypothetical protein